MFAEKEKLWGSWPGLSPFSVSVFVFPQIVKPSSDPMDSSLGCLEGPGIFLESLILLRVQVCVCGEGEVSQSGFTVPSSLSPDMQHSLNRSWQLQKTNLESQDSILGKFLILNKFSFLEYGQKTLV